MSYCLLVKGADGSLRLLCDAPYDSRGEALDALSAQAAADLVDGATDQVWLVDLNAVAPVVLFAKASGVVTSDGYDVTVEVEELETVVVETVDSDAGELVGIETVAVVETTHEPQAEPVSELEPEPEPVIEPEPEPEPEPDVEVEVETEPEAAPTPFEVEVSSMDDLLITQAQGTDAESSDAFLDLREALARSVAQMEAERETAMADSGITGESVADVVEPTPADAHVPVDQDATPEPDEEGAWPWAAIASVPEVTVPEAQAAVETPLASVTEPNLEFADAVADSSPSIPEAPIEPMSLGENGMPLIFDEGIVPELAEDLSVEPVTAPAAGEVPEPVVIEGTSGVPVDLEVAAVAAEEPPVSDVLSAEPTLETEAEVGDLQPTPSAYVVELDAIVAPTTVETPGYTPGSADVGSMSCDDCVWVDTCPNKDQRDPASCGSFQWK